MVDADSPSPSTREAQRADEDRRLAAAMAAAQRGDRHAYATLLQDCTPIIRRIARHQGIVPDALDDVVQDVLISIHGARQTYDPSRSFLAWLTALTQRRAIDAIRKQSRRGRLEVFDPDAFDNHAASDDPARDVEHKDAAAHVRQAIATLSPGQREAVETLVLQENSLEDASQTTGRTKTALKVNLHRALRALRLRLQPLAEQQDSQPRRDGRLEHEDDDGGR